MSNREIRHGRLAVDVIDTLRKNPALKAGWDRRYGSVTVRALEEFLRELAPGAEGIELSLTFCGETRIRNLNREYRQKDRPTDVLSFQNHDLRGQKGFEKLLHLGDIFICVPVARRQAKRLGVSLEEEIVHLFIHGALHVCGYDHELSAKEDKIMGALEARLLERVSGLRKRQRK